MVLRLMAAAAAAALLAGCGARDEDEDDPPANAAEAARPAAEGKAEEGRLSIKAPGVDIAISVPDSMRDRARAGADSELLPPGAAVSGIHIAGDGGDRSAGRDSVELRFVSDQRPEEVAAWYRDPARRPDFTIAAARREGEAILLEGSNSDGGGPMRVRLARRQGGTDGRLVLVDRD